MPLYRVGPTWYIDLPTRKGRARRSARTTDKARAQELHDKLKNALWQQERLGDQPAVTWGEAVKKWLAIKPRGIQDRYRLRGLELDPGETLPLQDPPLDELTGATYNRAAALIAAIHRASGVEPPKLERKAVQPGRTRWLTAAEWKRLQKALRAESPLLLQCAQLAIATGLRENNILELEWAQVDMKRRVAWIHADQAKAGQPIGVPLNDDAMTVLQARRGQHKQFAFANPDTGKPYVKASNKSWYAALVTAKLEGFRWHDLRHTWASWAVMGGVRLEELQRLGGWKTHQMVQRYAHLSPEHLASAAAKIKPVSMRYNRPRNSKK
jgi:integrase